MDWFDFAAGAVVAASAALIRKWQSRPVDPRGGWPTWDPPRSATQGLQDDLARLREENARDEQKEALADYDAALANIRANLEAAIEEGRADLEEAERELQAARFETLREPLRDAIAAAARNGLRQKEEEIAALREEIDRLRAEKGYR